MIRDLKPYAKYQDSGQGWLGRTPAGWQLLRAKYLFREVDARSATGREELLSVSHLTGVTPRRTKNITMFLAESNVGHKLCKPGDLVVNTMWAWMGALGVSKQAGIVSPAYGVYRPIAGERLLPAFADHLLRTPLYAAEYQRRSTGVNDSRLRLYPEQFLRIPVLLPPLDQQAAIVRFLDWANGRLERAIRAKRKVIALLNEQKQAIIHRAVSGSLGSGSQNRETGSQWFPTLPAAWELVPMRRVLLSAVDGPHFSPAYVDEGVPFLSARNVRTDRWSLKDVKYISEADYREFSKRVKPEPGDVLYTKGGTTGVARAVDLDFPFQVWVHIAVLKLQRERIDPKYLAYCLNSPRCYEQAQLFTRGATNQDLGLGRMKDIELPVPASLNQQAEIVSYLDAETGRFAIAADKLAKEIELLHEYRARMVAEVVTGQVDARHASMNLADLSPLPDPLAEADMALDSEET